MSQSVLSLCIPNEETERRSFLAAYDHNRRRSAFLLALLHDDALYEAPIRLRRPFIFYEGHIPAFSFLTLVRFALGGDALNEPLEQIFQRGIDPDAVEDAQRSAPLAWPKRSVVQGFVQHCDIRVRQALRSAQLYDECNPFLKGAQAVHNIIEHEQMHHETLLYILHHLPLARKRHIRCTFEDRVPPAYQRVHIDAGIATLGSDRTAIPFGWDNEFEEMRIPVSDFTIDVHNVTNGDYLRFVQAGGEPPPFWRKEDGQWHLLAQFAVLPLPKAWPVYTTHQQASAYAAWKGMRLPTEAEYHRAAFGTPHGGERAYPWGEAPPDATRGNFDFVRYDPAPIGSYPLGSSAWGVHDLIGNGWEWTSTLFEPFDGFEPMASYPAYSADFFDEKHYVMKGASPVTDRRLIRRTFRNWFRADYPYMYATFRCVTT